MPTTFTLKLRSPGPNDAPDGAGGIKNLADDVEAALVQQTGTGPSLLGAMQSNSSRLNQLRISKVGLVTWSFGLILSSGNLFNGFNFANVPPGFRPQNRTTFPCVLSDTNGNEAPGGVWLDPDGNCYVRTFGVTTMTRLDGGVPPFMAYS